MQSHSIRFTAVTKICAVVFFFIFFFLSFLQARLDNQDFWWHLATGKYIVERGSLPLDDPFSYTPQPPPSDRKSTLLKGYWLSQIIFYEMYLAWDFAGIGVLRAFLMLLLLVFVFLNVKKQTGSDFMALAFTCVMFLIAVPFSADRPQLFTFLIFSMVYYLLEDCSATASRKIYLIPVLVMILANMHPGFIVCVLLISVYLAASWLQRFVAKDWREKAFEPWKLSTVWILSVLSSTLNPAGWGVFRQLVHLSKPPEGLIEFMPPFFLFINKLTPLNYPYIAFLILSLLSLFLFRRIGLTRIALLVVFSLMSMMSIRYLIFYMCIAAPIIARAVVTIGRKKAFVKPLGAADAWQRFLSLAFSIIGVFLAFTSLSSLAKRDLKSDFLSAEPQHAADFLLALPVKGNMLNDYGFGGYLLWRLYPEKKVFIDGRIMDLDVYNEYRAVTLTKGDHAKSWRDIIRKYDISYVIVPPLLPQGQIYPLVEKLYDSSEWSLIYKDHVSLIFLLNDQRNISLVERYVLDKQEVLHAITVQARANAENYRTNPYYLISLGKALLKMEKHDEAKKAFLKAYERDPGNPETNRWIDKLGARR